MKVWRDGAWRLYWGGQELPWGYTALGVIEVREGDTGALFLSDMGDFVQGNVGIIRKLPQKEVIKVLYMVGQWGFRGRNSW